MLRMPWPGVPAHVALKLLTYFENASAIALSKGSKYLLSLYIVRDKGIASCKEVCLDAKAARSVVMALSGNCRNIRCAVPGRFVANAMRSTSS
jgi:hypothetical protein